MSQIYAIIFATYSLSMLKNQTTKCNYKEKVTRIKLNKNKGAMLGKGERQPFLAIWPFLLRYLDFK